MRMVARQLSRGLPAREAAPAQPLARAVEAARTILVVALAEVGDMVLLTPFLRELRRGVSAARIVLVCLPRTAVLFEASGDVDELIPYAAAARRVLRPFVLPRRARALAARHFRDGVDVAIVPRWDTDHHLASAVAVLSGAARRVAYSEHVTPRKATLNAGFDALFTDVIHSTGVEHEVERHMALLRAIGVKPRVDELRLSLTDSDRARAADVLATVPSGRAVVAIGLGAADPKRRWPVQRFTEAGRALLRDHDAHLVIVGGPDDEDAQATVVRALGKGATALAGRLTLRETAAVLERASLFVGNDSAPMHLAVAGGVPVVEISCHPAHGDPLHNNSPERFGPWRVRSAVLRPSVPAAPCVASCTATRPHCILGISVETVLTACAALLPAAGAFARDVRRG